jgi:hypothetical protein
MSSVSCKELIHIFEKVGGKLICEHDTRQCLLLPQNITAKIMPDNKVDIGALLSGFAYSGQFTPLPIRPRAMHTTRVLCLFGFQTPLAIRHHMFDVLHPLCSIATTTLVKISLKYIQNGKRNHRGRFSRLGIFYDPE